MNDFHKYMFSREKASSVLIEPTIPEDSDNEDSTNALSSRDTSVPDDGSSRKLSETEQVN